MNSDWNEVMFAGWPGANLQVRSERNLCAYVGGKLVADLTIYPHVKWAFFSYHYGMWGGDPVKAIQRFEGLVHRDGWTCAVKGPTPANETQPEHERDFRRPTKPQLDALLNVVTGYFDSRYPGAPIVDVCLYAGAAWHLRSGGKDGLGVRDLDVGVFLAPGGPKSIPWLVHLKTPWGGRERVVDLYWNVLKPDQTPREYIAEKAAKAKFGRWLTIPRRPWISLMTGELVWAGEME